MRVVLITRSPDDKTLIKDNVDSPHYVSEVHCVQMTFCLQHGSNHYYPQFH